MRFIGLIIALALALAAGLIAYNVVVDKKNSSSGDSRIVERPPEVETRNVLVAGKKIGIGEVLDVDSLDSQAWPSHLILDGFITTGDKSQKISGMVARATFAPGEPILLSKLSNPNDPGFIAANLPKGMRMVTIASDGIAGLAGFVFPGDRVDVLVTHPIPMEDAPENNPDAEETVTETILANARVLAVDQRATGGEEQEGKKKLPSSISLEVSLEDAQRLRLGQETGYLSLALRSTEEKDYTELPDITYVQDLSQTDVYEKGTNKKSIVLVRGIEQTEVTVSQSFDEEEVFEEENE